MTRLPASARGRWRPAFAVFPGLAPFDRGSAGGRYVGLGRIQRSSALPERPFLTLRMATSIVGTILTCSNHVVDIHEGEFSGILAWKRARFQQASFVL